LKIAVSGKGGVGKTTLSAMLAGTLALKGRCVIALDADPDANLASALGVPPDEQITPLCELQELIKERTGTTEGAYGGYFKLNPRVDDIDETYARRIGNIRLLVLGGVSGGGDGCICPATALLKALLVHLIMGRDDALVMDMEAGIEHLGRGTAQSMDAMIVVVNESPWSAQTALRVKKLAGNLGMKNILAVANRLSDPQNADVIQESLGDIPLIGSIPADDRVAGGIVKIDTDGKLQPCEALDGNSDSIEKILAEVEKRL
jgi:CO dehydrogenase maturation factor